jgi:hypothetical protein
VYTADNPARRGERKGKEKEKGEGSGRRRGRRAQPRSLGLGRRSDLLGLGLAR